MRKTNLTFLTFIVLTTLVTIQPNLHPLEEFAVSNSSNIESRVHGKVNVGSINVACVFSTGGLNNLGFNDMAYEGLQKAQTDGLCTFTYSLPSSTSDFEPELTTYASSGLYDLIIAVGFAQKAAVQNVASIYSSQPFLLIDNIVTVGNVSSVIFREEEGSFLVGSMAGLMTKTGKIGFIGGLDAPLIRKFWAGYEAGALYEKNRSYLEILEDFVGSFDDNTTAKAKAEAMWSQGVDIIFAVAGKSGLGVLESANEQGSGYYAIGVDIDQDDLYPGRVLTSMMKRVDVAVYNGILEFYNDVWKNGTKSLGLAEDGLGLSPLTHTQKIIGSEKIQEVNVTVRNKIISQEITAPNDSASLNQWITDMGIITGPISINNNGDFSSHGFPGAGTINNPYRISGFNLTGYSGTLISVSGTTDHFRIANCILNGMSTPGIGISFSNVMHGTIESNQILKNSDGIVFTYSHDNIIHNNSVFDSVNVGIRIGIGGGTGNNYDNNITMNTVFNNSEAGIGIYSNNHHNNIFNNTIFGNGAGIGFQTNSTNNEIQENLLLDNNGLGIYFSSSDNNRIRFNDFSSDSASDDSSNNVFEKNYWSDWTRTGPYPIGGSTGNQDTSRLTNPYHLSAPVITAPTGGTLTLKDEVTIEWTASSDTFGHSLAYSVLYSTDSGATWIEIASGMASLHYTWDLTAISNGTIILLKVQATDSIGFISETLSSSPFTIKTPLLTGTTTTTAISSGWHVLMGLLGVLAMLLLRQRKK
ncbi:MAG: BMP family ABC transporter substrate-binding protein [Candidatus Heimdallarchaeota archaeon]